MSDMIQFPWDDDSFSLCLDRFPLHSEDMVLPGVDEERLEEPWIRSSFEEFFPANDTLRIRYLHASFPYHDCFHDDRRDLTGSTTSSTLQPKKESHTPSILTRLFHRIKKKSTKRRQDDLKPLPALPPMLPPHQMMNEPIVVTEESYMLFDTPFYHDYFDPTMVSVGKKKKRTSMDSISKCMDYFKRPFSRQYNTCLKK